MNKHYVEKERYLHIENLKTGVEKKSKNAQINRNTTHTHRLRLITSLRCQYYSGLSTDMI